MILAPSEKPFSGWKLTPCLLLGLLALFFGGGGIDCGAGLHCAEAAEVVQAGDARTPNARLGDAKYHTVRQDAEHSGRHHARRLPDAVGVAAVVKCAPAGAAAPVVSRSAETGSSFHYPKILSRSLPARASPQC